MGLYQHPGEEKEYHIVDPGLQNIPAKNVKYHVVNAEATQH